MRPFRGIIGWLPVVLLTACAASQTGESTGLRPAPDRLLTAGVVGRGGLSKHGQQPSSRLTLLGKSWWAIFHAIVGSAGSAMSSRALAVAGQRQDRRSGRFDVTTRVHVARHAGDYT
jgi:hypothetical protein